MAYRQMLSTQFDMQHATVPGWLLAGSPHSWLADQLYGLWTQMTLPHGAQTAGTAQRMLAKVCSQADEAASKDRVS